MTLLGRAPMVSFRRSYSAPFLRGSSACVIVKARDSRSRLLGSALQHRGGHEKLLPCPA